MYVSLRGRPASEILDAATTNFAFLVPRDAEQPPPDAPRWPELARITTGTEAAALARQLRRPAAAPTGNPTVDFELTWRAARLAFGAATLAPDWDTQSAWIRWGLVWSLEAMATEAERRGDQRGLEGLAWLMANVGQYALLSPSAADRAQAGDATYRLASLILARDSAHAAAHNALGRVHTEVMRLSTPTRLMARMFMGSDFVSRASWAAAEHHLNEAVRLDPGMVQFRVDLAQFYALRGNGDRARLERRELERVPDRHPIDAWLRRGLASQR